MHTNKEVNAEKKAPTMGAVAMGVEGDEPLTKGRHARSQYNELLKKGMD
jgi:hypothetical protein